MVFQLTSKMKQKPIQNTTSAILLKLSFKFPFKFPNRDFNFDFFRFCFWNITENDHYNVSPPIFRNLYSQNYRIMPPLGKFIGFWHASGSSMTTRWCFLFENRFGFLFSAFISFITLSPISKYLKSVIFNLA